jgi:hypothetical protein
MGGEKHQLAGTGPILFVKTTGEKAGDFQLETRRGRNERWAQRR